MILNLKSYDDTVGTPVENMANILYPRFSSKYEMDVSILLPFLNNTYTVTANSTDEAVKEASSFCPMYCTMDLNRTLRTKCKMFYRLNPFAILI